MTAVNGDKSASEKLCFAQIWAVFLKDTLLKVFIDVSSRPESKQVGDARNTP